MVRVKRQGGTSRGSRWLSRSDWMEAGQQLLISDGIAGMRLTKLTKRLNVSTGSFYHHFSDMDGYLGALADYFNVAQVQSLVSELRAEYPDPLVRMRQLASRSTRTSLFSLDRAMRVWSASDPRAAAALKQAEKIVVDFMADNFESVGFNRQDALTRARILLTAAITPLLSISNDEERVFREEVLSVLLTPVVGVPCRDVLARDPHLPSQSTANGSLRDGADLLRPDATL